MVNAVFKKMGLITTVILAGPMPNCGGQIKLRAYVLTPFLPFRTSTLIELAVCSLTYGRTGVAVPPL